MLALVVMRRRGSPEPSELEAIKDIQNAKESLRTESPWSRHLDRRMDPSAAQPAGSPKVLARFQGFSELLGAKPQAWPAVAIATDLRYATTQRWLQSRRQRPAAQEHSCAFQPARRAAHTLH